MSKCIRRGPKKHFDWRLETPERAYEAGFRRLGIGALFGLSDWRREALCLAAHAQYLLKHCWKAQLTLSFPRLRPCAGSFKPLTGFADKHLVQVIAAFRICFPDVGLVLSTREPAPLRNGLIPLGITLMSAGSHTEPGGGIPGREKKIFTKQKKGALCPSSKTAANGRTLMQRLQVNSILRTNEHLRKWPDKYKAWAMNLYGKIGMQVFWLD